MFDHPQAYSVSTHPSRTCVSTSKKIAHNINTNIWWKRTSGPRSRTAGKKDSSLVLILVQVPSLKSLNIYQKEKWQRPCLSCETKNDVWPMWVASHIHQNASVHPCDQRFCQTVGQSTLLVKIWCSQQLRLTKWMHNLFQKLRQRAEGHFLNKLGRHTSRVRFG